MYIYTYDELYFPIRELVSIICVCPLHFPFQGFTVAKAQSQRTKDVTRAKTIESFFLLHVLLSTHILKLIIKPCMFICFLFSRNEYVWLN